MKKWAWLFLLTACSIACSKTPPPAPPPPAYVTVVKPQIANVPIYLEYIGHVEANQTVHVKAQISGTLMGQFFKEGQEVQKDDLLLTIDPSLFQAALDKARGQLAEHLANLEIAKTKVERYSKIVHDDYISKLNYEQLVADVCTAEAAIQQSAAEVETAQINHSYCTIRAPFTGMTGKLLVNVGNYVPVGGDSLLTLNQITPIRVSFYVPEKELPRIAALHQKKPLKTIVFQNGEPIEGELFLIDNQVDETTGTILLQATFPNHDKRLWPGEYLDVRLILDIQKDALLLPTEAVQLGQQGPYIYILKEETVELRTVTKGQKTDDHTVIESGLSPYETVVLEGQLNLYPGAKVALKP